MQTKNPNLFLIFIALFFSTQVTSTPQTNLLNRACSGYKAINPPIFRENLNATFSALGSQINGSTRFATAQNFRGPNVIYALFQCRDYLSLSDCLSCLSTATLQIRNCSSGIDVSARVIYDGCFLRYQEGNFYEDAVISGNIAVCGEREGLHSVTDGLLVDLSEVTPRMNGYFAAARRESGGNVVYGVAQCAHTVSKAGCGECLKVAYDNIRACEKYDEGRAVDGGCFLRYSGTAFFGDNFTMDLGPFLGKGSSKTRKTIIVGVVGGVGSLLVLVLFLFLLRWKSGKYKETREGVILATELRGPRNFTYNDLKSATKSFSKETKLGEGGFGEVYKGVLKNGRIVAVKKLSVSLSNRTQESFEAEVKLIGNVHHRNLVRLLGFCRKGPELLLVYEYMANGSLDKFLFGARRNTLSWKQRFDIIVGTAKGLAYLHEEFRVCIIHRDIKSSNILLDDDYQVKIADFGLVRLLPEEQSHLSTKVAGTLGYTAPEYVILGQLSEKVDVYSYGVVVLEIISGRRSNDRQLEAVTQYLLEWAWRLFEADMSMNLVDENLDLDENQKVEVKRTIEIALLCAQSAVASRPKMSEVVALLLSKGQVQRPNRPIFIDSKNRVQGGKSTSSGSSTSNATMSASLYSGR